MNNILNKIRQGTKLKCKNPIGDFVKKEIYTVLYVDNESPLTNIVLENGTFDIAFINRHFIVI